ncbi:DdrC, partial [Deinococcus sp. 14RED07]|nr:DdrC [Deinococcus sp. 14RED07]
MKNAPLTLEFGTVRLPISADGLLHAPSALTQLGLNAADQIA